MSYSDELTIENVLKALGISDYESLDNLLTYIVTYNDKSCVDVIEKVYKSGKDLKQYIKQFINYVLDVCKYQIYKDYNYIQIPNTIDLTRYDVVDYNKLLDLLDYIIELNNVIRYEQNPKVLIESKLLLFCKDMER